MLKYDVHDKYPHRGIMDLSVRNTICYKEFIRMIKIINNGIYVTYIWEARFIAVDLHQIA